MEVKSSSTFYSCFATYLSTPITSRRTSQLRIPRGSFEKQRYNVQQLRNGKVQSNLFKGRILKRQSGIFAISEDRLLSSEDVIFASKEENQGRHAEEISPVSFSTTDYEGTDGKPGLISFYNRPYKREDPSILLASQKNKTNILWFVGPAVLVASFIFPSLYLRKILSAVFEDSLLTDFLILFFTEALFYSGVAVYLLITDRLCRPINPVSAVNSSKILTPQLADRIASVTILVLSLIIPMVTMGLVWPWIGPAASATLAPYLVGIVVQFAFEQYARYSKSPSWPVIPITFQIYRLHQLNRAAQLVTALSFTVRGSEMTAHNIAINSSLGTLLNVLQFLGVICIWSLSSFIMRFFHSAL